MDLGQDKKTQITLDLLKELLSTMKGQVGDKLKPKAASVEVVAEPEGEEKEGLQEHLDKVAEEEIPEEVLEGITDDDEKDEIPEEEVSLASRRLAKRMR